MGEKKIRGQICPLNTRRNFNEKFIWIFCNIMKCFFVSCGIVLLFYFFNEEVPVTKELIQRNVLVICYSLLSLLCAYQITKRMFSDNDYNVITGTSLGYAKRIIRSENKNDPLTEYNRKVSSVHEAGHAVMAYLMKIESFQVILSDIQPRVVMVQKLQDANAVKKGILIKYAGAIAEEILLDKMHIGSFIGEDSDFPQATEWIKAYIVMTDSSISKTLLDRELEEKTILLSKKFWSESKKILSENRTMVEAISENLQREGTLTSEEVKDILDRIKK
ncbi:MAG: ATP-dependent Zn protease [Coprococcus phoceensis]